MLLTEMTFGMLVLKIARYGLIFLLCVAVIVTLFSKKISSTEKRGFWLDMAFAPLGLLYEMYEWLFGRKKSK
jgi:hypothetical protein